MSRARLCEWFERLCDDELVTVFRADNPEDGQEIWPDSQNPGPWKWEAVGANGSLPSYVGIADRGAYVRGRDDVRVGPAIGLFQRIHPFTLYIRFRTSIVSLSPSEGAAFLTIEFYGEEPATLDTSGNPAIDSDDNPKKILSSVVCQFKGGSWAFPTYPRMEITGFNGTFATTNDFPWGTHDWEDCTWYWLAIEIKPGGSLSVRVWKEGDTEPEEAFLSGYDQSAEVTGYSYDGIPVPRTLDQFALVFGLGDVDTAFEEIQISYLGIEHECTPPEYPLEPCVLASGTFVGFIITPTPNYGGPSSYLGVGNWPIVTVTPEDIDSACLSDGPYFIIGCAVCSNWRVPGDTAWVSASGWTTSYAGNAVTGHPLQALLYKKASGNTGSPTGTYTPGFAGPTESVWAMAGLAIRSSSRRQGAAKAFPRTEPGPRIPFSTPPLKDNAILMVVFIRDWYTYGMGGSIFVPYPFDGKWMFLGHTAAWKPREFSSADAIQIFVRCVDAGEVNLYGVASSSSKEVTIALTEWNVP